MKRYQMCKYIGIIGCISALIANDLHATWTISNPMSGTTYAPGSTVTGDGATTESSANYVLSIKDSGGTVWSQVNGTSTFSAFGASTWSATCANPNGGFPKGQSLTVIVKSSATGDSATTTINIGSIP